MIIMLSAWKQSGKDTVAQYLIEKYGFKRLAFADALKDMVAEEYSIPREWCDDPNFKEKPLLHLPVNPQDAFSRSIATLMTKEFRSKEGLIPSRFNTNSNTGLIVTKDDYKNETVYWSVRSLCILKGSTNRSVNPEYWTERTFSSLDLNNENYVISDWRYKSEFDAVLKFLHGTDISLLKIRINRFTNSISSDASERDLDDFNFSHVLNNKENEISLQQLHAQVDKIIQDSLYGGLNISEWC